MKAVLNAFELCSMPAEEQDRRLRAFAAAASGKPNGEVAFISERIRTLEGKIGATADVVKDEISRGVRTESWDVCQLLMLLHERDRLKTV